MVRNKEDLRAENVIDFEKYKSIRDLKNLKFLQVLAVRADPLTGEWIEDPFPTGEAVTSETWTAQEDLADIHFTTITRSNELTGQDQVYALMVNWIPVTEES